MDGEKINIPIGTIITYEKTFKEKKDAEKKQESIVNFWKEQEYIVQTTVEERIIKPTEIKKKKPSKASLVPKEMKKSISEKNYWVIKVKFIGVIKKEKENER